MTRTGLLLIVSIAAVLATGCGREPQATRAQSAKPAVAVHADTIARAAWPSRYEASGTVRARTAAQISSRLMAYVREVRVRVGDPVRQGQVVAVLDARDADVHKRQADAAREEARSSAVEAEQAHASAKANVELAEATFARMKDLYDKTSISRQEFDEATARVKMARASLEMAAARRAQVSARIAQTEQEGEAATLQQGYSVLSAPFSGVITEKTVEPGNLAVPGAALMTIERGGDYRLEASVEESMMHGIRLGQKVMVELDALDREVAGRVSEIVPGVDAGSRSGTVKIDLPPVAGLRSGLFGRARFETSSRTARLAPVSALGERGQVQWVFVADSGIAHSRIVTTGERRGDRVEVLSGLSEGERVIAPLPAGLADGDRIEVKP